MPSLARQGRKIYSLANSNYHYWWTAVRKLRVGFNTFAATNHHRRQSFFGIFRPQAVSFLFIISILCRHSSFTLLNRCHIALYFFLSSHVLSAIFLSITRTYMRTITSNSSSKTRGAAAPRTRITWRSFLGLEEPSLRLLRSAKL